MIKKYSSSIFIFVAIFGVILMLWSAYFAYMLTPVSEAETSVPFAIEKGDGFKDIASTLEDRGAIRSAKFFKIYSLLFGKAHKLKPGLYSVNPASSTIDIVKLLVSGPGAEAVVLVTEGENLQEIDDKLSSFGIIKRGELLNLDIRDLKEEYSFLQDSKNLEGFLFPDTYRFFFESGAEGVARVFLDNFMRKVGEVIPTEGEVDYQNIPILRKGMFSIKEIVTIASMIEKEVPDSAERKIVADIIYKRLKIGMALQIDATIDYAEENGKLYNTYKYSDLPPGPISNPGLDAIEAALNPKISSYLYYLSDPETKETIFSRDFEEHKRNKEKYLR